MVLLRGKWLNMIRTTKKLMYFHIMAFFSLPLFFIFSNTIDYILAFIVYFLMAGLGQAITYHRLLSHKSFTAPRWFFLCGNLFTTFAGVGSGLGWAANHLKHHRFSDMEKDTHSPHYQSKWQIWTSSMASEVDMKYAASLIKNETLIWFHENYWKIHGTYLALLLGFYPFGVISMYLAPASITWLITCSVNIYCHIYGYRNFDTKDKSTNNLLIGYVTTGEGWHNNHHKYPGSYTTQIKWWEIDPLGWIIKLIGKDLRKIEDNK